MAKKILIVEDDVAIGSMYEFKLKKRGFVVANSTNGADGLKTASSFLPDLILLDLLLPQMNGDELLEKLRKTDWGASIRIIILTNLSKDEAPMSLRLLRVDRYIVKAHYTPSQVVDIVQEVLDKNPAAV